MNYQKIYSFDLANGEGIRVSIFVSGCNIHCKGCFNKESWDFNCGLPFTSKEYFSILKILDNPLYDGISILGGEPFDQEELSLLIELSKMAHEKNKDVWIWSGHTFNELMEDEKKKALLESCDVLIEGPFIEEQKDLTLKWRGSKNQRILDIQKSLIEKREVEYE